MIDDDETYILNHSEDCITPTERWTKAQISAKYQIFRLNLAYPGRWFTKDEFDHVVFSTLDSFVSRGMLETKYSEVNPNVRYFRVIGKWVKDMYMDEMKKRK